MQRKYYSLERNKQTATINIYGDITSWPWFEEDVSAYNLSKQLEELSDVSEINVYIKTPMSKKLIIFFICCLTLTFDCYFEHVLKLQ